MADHRVLSVVTRFNVGGPAAILTAMLDGLDPAHIAQVLAVGRVDAGKADWRDLRAPQLRTDRRVVDVAALRRPLRPGHDLLAYHRLRRLMLRLRPDIVHTHTAKAGLLGRLAALHAGVPAVVHTFHGHTLHGYFDPVRTAAFRRLDVRLAQRTDALLAVGRQVRDELLAAGIGTPDQYTVLPPAIVAPTPVDPAAARRRWGIGPGQPTLGYVGRLAGVKRPDRLVQVVARVAAVHPDLVVLVAGGGEADAGLRDDLCGRPVVATAVGSVAEVVLDGRTGRVVAPRADTVADAVLDLLADPARRAAYGQAAAARTRARFGSEAVLAATAAVYDRLGRDLR